jgi:tetratricopeptide (TPR) repeat protein
MTHKSGQVEQNHSQSNFKSSSEVTFSSSVAPLTDANYEFLFNQLLEGVAHGWHSVKIVKFFQRLEDRGQQKDWVAWLERFSSKIPAISSISMQQMATLMVRLGELTQSTPEVKQIGAISYKIGRKILFGDTSNLIWEYNGADIQLNTRPTTASSNAEIKEESLSELNLAAKELTDKKLFSISEVESLEMSPVNSELESSQALENKVVELELEDFPHQAETIPLTERDIQLSALPVDDRVIELEELTGDRLEKLVDNIELNTPRAITEKSEPESNMEGSGSVGDFPQHQPKSPENQENSHASIPADRQLNERDWQELMNMIQEHDRLAQEISKKLNISPRESSQPDESQPKPTEIPQSDRVNDNSIVELVESWFNLGLKQVSTGDFNGAIASWEKALNLNPNLSEAWHNRGSALGRLNRYEEAIESFERSLLLAGDNYQAWNDRAHALYQLEKWQEARESWEKAIEIMPGNHLFWYNRGCALEQLNKLEESIASYEKALEIQPDFQPARSRYINLVADNFPTN